MADYQEYRRRILHRRWRRVFITAALLILLVLLAAVGILWKRLHREPSPNTAQQGPTILQQELTGSEWNTISYTPARRLNVQTLDNGMTAMDFRLAAQTASPAVERSSFSDVSFLGDSLTQGMQLYDTGLPNAHFCAYKGVGPNAVVNNTTCRRADGEKEIPMEALASQQPRALYVLLGTNVLTADNDYSSFLTYYRLMLDMISQALPNTKIYVQSITPVRPEVNQKSPGLYKQRLCEINDALSAIALEKGCTFLNLWEALADENQHMDGRVVVIGGGDTGNDCVGTAIRQGCASVTQLEMMPQPPLTRAANNPWPEWPKVLKTDYGQEEAIAVFGHDPRIYKTTVKEFHKDKNGNLKELTIVSLESKKDEKTGRFMMVPVEGSEKKLPAELVLIAAGFLGTESYVAKAFGVELNARTNVSTQEGHYATNVKNVYVAGDNHRGQSLVVWAIREGREAAREVDESLMGYSYLSVQ